MATGFYETREAAEAYFSLENYMVQSAVGALGMGLVTTVIVGLFLRTRAQNTSPDEMTD